MEWVAFWVLAVLAVASAMVVLTHRNEVICALALAFNLVSISGLYFLLDAQFIGFLQLIVYAGAIMVLILFVVMLLSLGNERYARKSGWIQPWLAMGFTWVFASVLGVALWQADLPPLGEPAAGFGTVAAVGGDLFSKFFYPFEVISLLLIAAMIGAVLLAKRRL